MSDCVSVCARVHNYVVCGWVWNACVLLYACKGIVFLSFFLSFFFFFLYFLLSVMILLLLLIIYSSAFSDLSRYMRGITIIMIIKNSHVKMTKYEQLKYI